MYNFVDFVRIVYIENDRSIRKGGQEFCDKSNDLAEFTCRLTGTCTLYMYISLIYMSGLIQCNTEITGAILLSQSNRIYEADRPRITLWNNKSKYLEPKVQSYP